MYRIRAPGVPCRAYSFSERLSRDFNRGVRAVADFLDCPMDKDPSAAWARHLREFWIHGAEHRDLGICKDSRIIPLVILTKLTGGLDRTVVPIQDPRRCELVHIRWNSDWLFCSVTLFASGEFQLCAGCSRKRASDELAKRATDSSHGDAAECLFVHCLRSDLLRVVSVGAIAIRNTFLDFDSGWIFSAELLVEEWKISPDGYLGDAGDGCLPFPGRSGASGPAIPGRGVSVSRVDGGDDLALLHQNKKAVALKAECRTLMAPLAICKARGAKRSLVVMACLATLPALRCRMLRG